MPYKQECQHAAKHKYCEECGLGRGEWLACELPDCGDLLCSTHCHPVHGSCNLPKGHKGMHSQSVGAPPATKE